MAAQHLPLRGRRTTAFARRSSTRRRESDMSRDCSMHTKAAKRPQAEADEARRVAPHVPPVRHERRRGGGRRSAARLQSAGRQSGSEERQVGDRRRRKRAPQNGVFAPNAFIQIDTAGKVTLVIPKVEMGRGVLHVDSDADCRRTRSAARHGHRSTTRRRTRSFSPTRCSAASSPAVRRRSRYAWEPMRRAGAAARIAAR